MNQRQRVPATSTSWRIHPCPEARAVLAFSERYRAAEFEEIRAGLIPSDMDDRWFMFFEEPWLFIHRSWTGFCTYGLRFDGTPDGARVVEAWASRDTAQCRETSAESDVKTLKYLIDVLLLGKTVA